MVLGGLAACSSTGGQAAGEETSGRIELGWSEGPRPVRFATGAIARWCAADSLLEITGTRNDTAVGLVLLSSAATPSGLGPGSYSVMPAGVFIPWRPRAIAALRLAAATTVRSYQSESGQVSLTTGGGSAGPAGLSGTLDLLVKATSGSDSLHLTGSFRGLKIVSATSPCTRLDKPPPAPG